MRSVLIALLLAGAATPAIAGDFQSHSRGDRGERRSEESSSDSRPNRPQRDAEPRHERSAPADNGERHSGGQGGRQQSFDGGGGDPSVERVRHQDAGDSVRNWRRQQGADTATAEPQHIVEPHVVRPPRNGGDSDVQESGGASVRHWRTRDRDGDPAAGSIERRNLRRAPGSQVTDGSLVQSRHPVPAVFDRRDRRVSRTPILGTEPPAPRTATNRLANPAHRWRTDWRHDRRYDWRDWRRRHRSHLNFGFYFDPFGWDYFRYGIGWRLWPSYYRNNYWLNDPWQYRLPPAYGPYRWIRYFNDALLVNIYTGQVVDVEYDFFW